MALAIGVRGNKTVEDKTDVWSTFYKEDVRPVMTLPPELTLVKAGYASFWNGYSYYVRFKLPPSREPHKCIEKVVRDSRSDHSRRISRRSPDVRPIDVKNGPSGPYFESSTSETNVWLKYLPQEKVYEAYYEWLY